MLFVNFDHFICKQSFFFLTFFIFYQMTEWLGSKTCNTSKNNFRIASSSENELVMKLIISNRPNPVRMISHYNSRRQFADVPKFVHVIVATSGNIILLIRIKVKISNLCTVCIYFPNKTIWLSNVFCIYIVTHCKANDGNI